MSIATDILGDAGLSTGPDAERRMNAWIACESPGKNNPLSVTGNWWNGINLGAVLANNAGNPVYDFLTLAAGEQADAQNLRGNAGNYGPVRDALNGGTDQDFVNAIAGSGWGTDPGCVARNLGTVPPQTGSGSSGAGGSGSIDETNFAPLIAFGLVAVFIWSWVT